MDTQQDYNGHTITLTEEWRFRIAGPLVTDRVHQWADSIGEAKERIDTIVKQDAATHRVRLSIPVYIKGGESKTVTGVHGGHLKALGIGDADEMYPAHPAIRKLLQEAAELRRQSNVIDKTLMQYRVRAMPDRIGVREHAAAVEDIQRRLADALAKANAAFGAEAAAA